MDNYVKKLSNRTQETKGGKGREDDDSVEAE